MDAQAKRHQWRDHWSIHTATDNGYDESPVTPKASNNFVTEGENVPMPDPSGARIAPAAPSHTQGHYRVGVEATDGPQGVVAGTPFAQRLSGGNQLEQSCWNKSSGRRQEYQLGQPPVLARYPPKDFVRASDQLCQAPNGSGGGTPRVLNPHASPEVHEVPVCAPRNHPEPPPHLHNGPLLDAPRDSALHQVPQNSTNTVSSSKGYQVPIDTADGLASASQGDRIPPHLRGRPRGGPTTALSPAPRSRDAPTAAPCSDANGVVRKISTVGDQDIQSAVGNASKPLQSSGTPFNTHQNIEHQHEQAAHEQAQQSTNVPKHPGGSQEVAQHFPLESSPKLSKEASAETASAAGWKPTDRPDTRLRGASSASTYRSLGSELVFQDDSVVPPRMGWEASTYDPTAPSDLRWGLPTEQPVEQDWNVTRPPRRQVIQSDPELSGSTDSEGNFRLHIPSFLRRWILRWVLDAPGEIKTSFLEETSHERCDVDTYSGCLTPPVVYPASKRHPRDTASYQPGLGLTSTIRIKAKCKRLEKIETVKRRQLAAQQDLESRKEMARLEEENQKHLERFRCRIECHLRPAQEEDMSDVAAIYNDEVRNGWRALDQEPVPAEKFRNVLAVTHRQGLPFFVALSGWRDPNVPLADAGHKVIGFAFVDIAGRGIIGSTETHSRTLRLYVVVERGSREKRLGTAMIDAVLQLVSPQYIAKERAYQFVNPHKNPIYRAIPQNPKVRPWRSVIMEVYVENLREKKLTETGTEYKTVWNWLEEDHRMMLINHLEMCSKASHLSDQWLDRLLFEHKCRDPTSMAGRVYH